MTGIRGHIKSEGRPGEPGVHSLDHFHFVVPDLAAAESFYSEFGLAVTQTGQGLALGTRGQPHAWGTIGEGPRKKHQYMSFGVFEDDIGAFAKRLQEMRIARLDPPKGVEFERPLVPRPRRKPGRDRGRPEDLAERQERVRLRHRRAGHAGGAVPARRHAHLSPAPRPCPHVHPRRAQGDRFLHARARHAALRPFGRRHRLPSRRPRQRSSHGGVREIERARHPPPELGRRERRRDRRRGDAYARKGPRQGLGPRTARARIELFPLCPRSLGQLQRIFGGHRLRPRRLPLGSRRQRAGGILSTSGAPIRPRTSW